MKTRKTESGLYVAETEIVLTPRGERELDDAIWNKMVAGEMLRESKGEDTARCLKQLAEASRREHEIRSCTEDSVKKVRDQLMAATTAKAIRTSLVRCKAAARAQRVLRDRLMSRGIIAPSTTPNLPR